MKIHIEITDEQYKKLQDIKKRNVRSMQYLVVKAIEQYLRKREET